MSVHVFRLIALALLSVAMVGSRAEQRQSPPFLEARTRILLGQLEQAVALAKSNDAELSPEQSAYLMAKVYAEIGQDEKALQILSSVEPLDLIKLFKDVKLEIYAQTGNAFELQKQLPASASGDQPGLKYFALAAMRKSGSSKYLKALKAKAADRSDKSAAYDLAWVYFQMGAYAESIKILKSENSSASTRSATSRTLLALSFQRIHQQAKACQALDLKSSSTLKSFEDAMVINLLGELLPCSEKPSELTRQDHAEKSTPESSPQRAPATSGSSDALTMKPHGAFKSNETRVSYVDRFNGNANRNLPIPEGVGITGASGILLGQGNFVLTNRHVVEEGRYFAVKNALGSVSKAKVVKVSELDDLAVLELEEPFPSNLAISTDEISAAKAGGQIYSMGYPLWYLLGTGTPSITNGLVSKNSGMNDDPKMFQITAKINKGNSGGPVFDRFGHLIGLTTAKLDTEALRQSEGVDPEGVNFIYQSKEILEFAGRFMDSRAHAPTASRSLTAEEVYEKRLGATVMVAVGR